MGDVVSTLQAAELAIGACSLAAFAAILLWVVRVDLREQRIPNKAIFALVAVWLAARAAWALAVFLGVSGMDAALDGSSSFAAGESSLDVSALALGGLWPWDVPVADGFLGAVALGGGALVVSAVYEALTGRYSMGGGDVKLLAVLGLYLGLWTGLVALLIACICAVTLSVVLPRMGWEPAGGHPSAGARGVPFAPALAAGVAVSLLWSVVAAA